MLRRSILFAAPLLVCLAPTGAIAQTPVPDAATQIAGAVAPAPADYREGARVLGYDDAGALVTLREGAGLVCLADDPTDERFHSACYFAALEPFMAKGRELRAQGLSAADVDQIREMQIRGGTLPMPKGSALYSITAPSGAFDPATGAFSEGNQVYVIYLPFATGDETGLPEKPPAPGAPWLMGPGTATAHVMVVQPVAPAVPEEPSDD